MKFTLRQREYFLERSLLYLWCWMLIPREIEQWKETFLVIKELEARIASWVSRPWGMKWRAIRILLGRTNRLTLERVETLKYRQRGLALSVGELGGFNHERVYP